MIMNKKILVIDDNEDIRFTFLEICRFAGWEGFAAPDGKSGINLFLEVVPDIVLVDYHMPEMDGISTVRALRELNTEVPILSLTVDERQEVANAILANGANDFILKPLRAPDLISRIKIHLQKSFLESHIPLPQNYSSSQLQSENLADKGLSRKTMELLREHFIKQQKPETMKEISTNLGISYPTVHRYIQYLVEQNLVKQEIDYGGIGRPTHHFRWIGNVRYK